MGSSEKFKVESFSVITDSLFAILSQKQMAYNKLRDLFDIFRYLEESVSEMIKDGSSKLIEAYSDDLESELSKDLIQFSELLKTELAKTISENQQDLHQFKLYKIIQEKFLGFCFPNDEIVLRSLLDGNEL